MHFTLLAISANPFPDVEKGRLDGYAQWYTYPYFSQNWNLFVPPPNTNYKLFVEYEDNGVQRKDLFNEILLRHQTNRLKGYGPLVLAFTNTIHYFEKTSDQRNALNGPVKNNMYFQMIEKSALSYLRSTCGQHIKNIKIRLVVKGIDEPSERVYFN